tara:strand:- start:586 stop:762 length:177 start_codon:yes stop_codon:yes gene_type:complete
VIILSGVHFVFWLSAVMVAHFCSSRSFWKNQFFYRISGERFAQEVIAKNLALIGFLIV